jgi:hypothetical protein
MPRLKYDELRVFSEPAKAQTYVIGGDVAQGLEHGDDSVLQVISVKSGRQVAEYYLPNAAPPEVGEEAFKLGKWYNNAYIGIENNADLTALYKLHELGYANLHYQENLDASPSPDGTRKMGWNTNLRTRYIMVDDGREWLKEGLVAICSPWLLDQMEIFAQNARGKYEAIPGGHDDLVMAWLIAVQMMKLKLTRQTHAEEELAPLWEGQPVDSFEDMDPDGRPLTREARISARMHQKKETPDYQSTVGNLI